MGSSPVDASLLPVSDPELAGSWNLAYLIELQSIEPIAHETCSPQTYQVIILLFFSFSVYHFVE